MMYKTREVKEEANGNKRTRKRTYKKRENKPPKEKKPRVKKVKEKKLPKIKKPREKIIKEKKEKKPRNSKKPPTKENENAKKLTKVYQIGNSKTNKKKKSFAENEVNLHAPNESNELTKKYLC
jgi:hypothetical protein